MGYKAWKHGLIGALVVVGVACHPEPAAEHANVSGVDVGGSQSLSPSAVSAVAPPAPSTVAIETAVAPVRAPEAAAQPAETLASNTSSTEPAEPALCNVVMSEAELCRCIAKREELTHEENCAKTELKIPGYVILAPQNSQNLYLAVQQGDGMYVAAWLEEWSLDWLKLVEAKVEQAGTLPVLRLPGHTQEGCEAAGDVVDDTTNWAVLCPIKAPGEPVASCPQIPVWSRSYHKIPGEGTTLFIGRLSIRLTKQGGYVIKQQSKKLTALQTYRLGDHTF